MKRTVFTILLCWILLVLLSPQSVFACQRCKPAGWICSGDECEKVYICAPLTPTLSGKTDCGVDQYGCNLSGDECLWAERLLDPGDGNRSERHEKAG